MGRPKRAPAEKVRTTLTLNPVIHAEILEAFDASDRLARGPLATELCVWGWAFRQLLANAPNLLLFLERLQNGSTNPATKVERDTSKSTKVDGQKLAAFAKSLSGPRSP